MKKFIRLSLVIMMSLMFVACGNEGETVYTVEDFKEKPELIEAVIMKHEKEPTEISAKNVETAQSVITETITETF